MGETGGFQPGQESKTHLRNNNRAGEIAQLVKARLLPKVSQITTVSPIKTGESEAGRGWTLPRSGGRKKITRVPGPGAWQGRRTPLEPSSET